VQIVPWADPMPRCRTTFERPAGPIGADVARPQVGRRGVERADRSQHIVSIRLDEARVLAVGDGDA
jgi:hypothetical protein